MIRSDNFCLNVYCVFANLNNENNELEKLPHKA